MTTIVNSFTWASPKLSPNLDHPTIEEPNAQPIQQLSVNSPRDFACYRASLPIMALAYEDNQYAAVTIGVGEIFEVIGPAN